MKGDDLANRFLDFAARVMHLVQALPKSMPGRHVGNQLLRCGTSPGANYEEARGAESRADFIHKLAIVWKEIRESCYWLQLVHRAALIHSDRVEAIHNEAQELSRILSKSLITARNNKDQQ